MNDGAGRSELRWVIGWALVIVALSSLPYVWGALITPEPYCFLGLTHNIDDGAVYLSWMRQAADGHFFIRNLFTNEPQAAKAFNILFLVMGWVAALTRLPLVAVFHGFRVVLGAALILMVWQFSKLFLDDPAQRRILIPLVGLSSGIGWFIPGAKAPDGPVDVWQPEAITFLSIYLNPLFLAGLLLMLCALYFLVLAQRTGRMHYAVCAGLSMFALGNIHTYDVLTVACVWTAYLAILGVLERRLPARTILLSSVAALIACPTVAYQFYVYCIDPVFAARANSPTPSPAIWSYFAGYGIILVGAVAGAWLMIRRRGPDPVIERPKRDTVLVVAWSVIGFVLPYIPVGQQRKLVMGLHIPLCILCAYALCRLLSRLPKPLGRLLAVALMLACVRSNVDFVANDIRLLQAGRTVTHYEPFVVSSATGAMGYLRDHAAVSDTVLAPPTLALFTPALAGIQVYYGHWSETPDYAGKLRRWASMESAPPGESACPPSDLLRETGAVYLVRELGWFGGTRDCGEYDLQWVYGRSEIQVYRVNWKKSEKK